MQTAPPRRDEIDFRDLLRKPEKLFGSTYLYYLGALILIGLLYGWSLTDIGKNTVRPLALRDSSAFAADIPLRAPVAIPPVDVMTASRPTSELLSRGRELYQGNCSSCHGEAGAGDGPTAPTLNPKPRSFLQVQNWSNGSTVSGIYRTLEEGIVRNGMPSFNYLTPTDRFALVHYVRSFASGHPTDTPEQLRELEAAYELSRGRVSAAQIPVRRAVQLLVREGRGRVDALERLSEELAAGRSGSALFGRIVADTARVLTAFVLDRFPVPSPADLVKAVSADPVTLGFRPAALQLTEREWEDLHRLLNGLRAGRAVPSSS